MKPRAELFDIANKKDDQRRRELAMTPEERLILCLDLMDLGRSLNVSSSDRKKDDIDWIVLKPKANHG